MQPALLATAPLLKLAREGTSLSSISATGVAKERAARAESIPEYILRSILFCRLGRLTEPIAGGEENSPPVRFHRTVVIQSRFPTLVRTAYRENEGKHDGDAHGR